MGTRYIVNRGTKTILTATFDTTSLPSGSLNSLNIEWMARRTLSQMYYDIYKTSASGSIVTVSTGPPSGVVNVYLEPADTIPLIPGNYYWSFRLFDSGGVNVDTISPSDTTGDITVLNPARII